VRNEALETHYLNHLELLEARHGADEFVLPDEHGPPLAVRDLRPPVLARDRAGRDVTPALRAADGVVFSTDSGTLARAGGDDLDDHIDLTFPAAGRADSVALVLRVRNSLLNTVLLYDGALGAGARALDWMGQDLQRVSGAVAMGRWYNERMGMHVAVRAAAGYRVVARVGDTGPIAYHDVAVIIPVVPDSGRSAGRDDTLRIRLSFTADNWRIDRVAIAGSFRRPNIRTIPVQEVRRDDGTADTAARASLRSPDESYLVTSPGQRFGVVFDVGTADRTTGGSERTFLLASQGYYTEWVRGAWIKAPTAAVFTPSDLTLADVLRRWQAKRTTFERQFYTSRVPVR
jgi:hypothetical protein